MSAQDDDDLEPLVTECPYCRTRFRVSDQQLVAASGRVRCGACLQVFQGNAHLLFESEFESTEDANAALDELLDDLTPTKAEGDALTDSAASVESDASAERSNQPLVEDAVDDSDGIELVDRAGNEDPPTLPDVSRFESDAAREAEPLVEAQDQGPVEELLFDSVSTRAISQAVATARAGLAAGPDSDVLAPDWQEADAIPVDGPADDQVAIDPEQAGGPDRAGDDLDMSEPERSDIREVDSLDELDALLDDAASLEPANSAALASGGALSEAEGSSLEAEGSLSEAEGSSNDGGPAVSGSWARFELVDDAAGETAKPDEVGDTRASGSGGLSDDSPPVKESGAQPQAGEAVAIAPDSVAADDLAELLREMESPRRRNWLAPVVIVGVIALIAEVLYLQFDQWSLDPTFRPIYSAACTVLPCELEARRDVGAIRSLAHEFKSDPNDPERMLLDLQFASDADFAQPFPTIEVTFRARTGALISTQSTPPEAYLHGDADGLTELMPKTPVRVTVSLTEVSGENYQITFR